MNKSPLTLCLALVLAGCTSMSQEAKTIKKQPANCATAKSDIKVLEDEKASVSRQAASGVVSVMPSGMAMGVLTGTSRNRASVATGSYNQRLDDKIAEIKQTCGL